MTRRFYGFNSEKLIREHITQIKTIDDVFQLQYDIGVSQTNLCCLKDAVPGVWVLDSVFGENGLRHAFVTQRAFSGVKNALESEVDSYTVLEESTLKK